MGYLLLELYQWILSFFNDLRKGRRGTATHNWGIEGDDLRSTPGECVKKTLRWPLKGCACFVARRRPISFGFCVPAVAASWECCKINSSWRHSCWSLVSAYCLTGRRLGNTTRGRGWAPSLCLAHALCCKLKGECSEITHSKEHRRLLRTRMHLTEWNNLFLWCYLSVLVFREAFSDWRGK